MIARALESGDIDKLKEIHSKHYTSEFSFPDFVQHYLGSFVILDNDEIVCAGGVRTIAESILITNKDIEFYKKLEGLGIARTINEYITKQNNYTELHAFIQDPVWRAWLKKSGFHKTKGTAYLIEV